MTPTTSSRKRGPDPRIYRRILAQARPCWPHLAGSIALNVVAIPLTLLLPLPLKIAVDNAIGGQPLPSWLRATGPTGPTAVLLVAAALLLAVGLLMQAQILASWLLAGAHSLKRARGDIRFENVSFAYDRGRTVLENASFRIPAGARVGIVGRTGSGKSTLVGLLTRFHDVTGGCILLDDIDLRDYRLRDLRNQFAIVLQEPFLFSSSIADNISFDDPHATREQIEAAGRAAGVQRFVEKLPEGYDTHVGERGTLLSGGQRQRISVARAFLKDAPILILDEPTSAVDTQTESQMMEATTELMRGRTSFLIAHRLSTVRDCDTVLVLEDGGVRVMSRLKSLGSWRGMRSRLWRPAALASV